MVPPAAGTASYGRGSAPFLPARRLSGGIGPTLEEDRYLEHFCFAEQVRGLEGLLRPGGLLVYGHGPFLGKNPRAVVRALEGLGFTEVEQVGDGDYTLITARMPEALAQPRALLPEAPVRVLAEPPPQAPPASPQEVWALLEAGDYAGVLARVPAGASGELAYLRGRALLAPSRYAEAEEALARAGRPEAEDLRALCWAGLEELPAGPAPPRRPWPAGGDLGWPWARCTWG